jgi:hypothetical protein
MVQLPKHARNVWRDLQRSLQCWSCLCTSRTPVEEQKRRSNGWNRASIWTDFQVWIIASWLASICGQSWLKHFPIKGWMCQRQNYLCCIDGRPQVLGFTTASGEPVRCAAIFAAKMLHSKSRTGLDPLVRWIGDPDDILTKCNDGKQYPFRPSCLFEGKEAPCYCCCSESGSINGHLLK